MKRRHWILNLTLAFLIIGYSLSKYAVDERVQQRLSETDVRFIPNPVLGEFLSFGFEPAMADAYWIEALNYYGGELLNRHRSYTFIKPYCELILKLDPLFTVFYNWAATAFIYTGFDVTSEAVANATRYLNLGILNLNEYYRYDRQMIEKAAFNYALEAQQYLPSLPYFEMAGRMFQSERTMYLVGATYAGHANRPQKASELKLEFLGHIAFEARSKADLQYALDVLSSPNVNSLAAEFVRSLRLKMESDEEVRKLVAKRLSENPILQSAMSSDESKDLFRNKKLENALTIDLNRTWLPTEMLVLFSL